LKKCCVEDCERPVTKKGYCEKHYQQMWKNGYIFKENEYIIDEKNIKIAYLIIYNKDNSIKQKVLIDTISIDKLKLHKWYSNKNGYLITSFNNKKIYMHRLLLNIDDSEIIVDHIDRNVSNNTLVNLRATNRYVNAQNSKISKNNTSGICGVLFDIRENSWYSTIHAYDKDICIYCDSKNEAIETRLILEVKYMPETLPQKYLYEEFNVNLNPLLNKDVEIEKTRKDNSSGVIGVCWNNRIKKWVSNIIANKIRTNKSHKSKLEAIHNRFDLEIKHLPKNKWQKHLWNQYNYKPIITD
jgi:hypothetical protein